MAFSKRRGRPKSNKEQKDLGTKELQAKLKENLTVEAIDLLLKKSLISAEQHQAALRLRWLYSLKFGALALRAYNPNFIAGTARYEEQWKLRKEKEYQKLVAALSKIKALNIVFNVAVFNLYPKYLLSLSKKANLNNLLGGACLLQEELEKLKEGLELLIKLFKKKYSEYSLTPHPDKA